MSRIICSLSLWFPVVLKSFQTPAKKPFFSVFIVTNMLHNLAEKLGNKKEITLLRVPACRGVHILKLLLITFWFTSSIHSYLVRIYQHPFWLANSLQICHVVMTSVIHRLWSCDATDFLSVMVLNSSLAFFWLPFYCWFGCMLELRSRKVKPLSSAF